MELFRLLGTIAVNDKEAIAAINSVSGNAAKTSSKMSKAFKTVGLALAGAFSVAKMTQFGKACIEAYNVQSQAELKLETIMKQRMGSSDKAIQKTKDLTSAQQRLGVVGDELQLSGAQQLSTFLSSEKALNSLIPAMNNLAVQQNGVNVTSENMVSIGNMMGKVMQGQTAALTRVGITFTEAQEKALKYGTEEEKAAVLAQVITDNVGKMNEEFAKTDAGKIQQAKNLFGDLQEMIGGKLIGSVANAYQALGKFSVFVMDNFDAIISVTKGVATAFAGIGATKLILSLVSGFQKASLQVALFGMSADSAAFSQAILNGELTLGESIIAIFTGKVKLSKVASDAWNNSVLKLTLSQISHSLATAKNTAATKASTAADALKSTSLYKLITAHKLATVAALGLAAPIIALVGYMIATGSSAEETAARITAFANKLALTITQFANQLPTMINSIIPAITQVVNAVVMVIPSLVPVLIQAGIQLFTAIIQSIQQIIPPLVAAIPQIVNSIISALTILIPALLSAAVTLFMALVQAIPKVIPQLIAAIPKLIVALVQALVKSGSKILQAGMKLIAELAKGLIQAIPQAVKAAPKIVKAVVNGIKSGGKTLISVGSQLVKWLGSGISSLVGWIGGKAISLAKGVVNKIKAGVTGAASAGANIVKGIWSGISGAAGWLYSKVASFAGSIIDKLKSKLGIHSPSKVAEEQIGKNLALGVAEGIHKNKKYAKKKAGELAQIIVDTAKKRLDKYQTYNEMTLVAEMAFWDKIRKQCKKGTDARLEADKQYFEVKKSLNEQLKQLEDDYIAKIETANQKIADRAKSLLNAFNLFDEFAIKVDEENPLTSEKLINNLESQVNALTDWTSQMESLGNKIGNTGLYKALQDMGVSSLQQVQLINQMSEEELKKYTELYDKRAEIAKKQAESELGTEVMNEMMEAYKSYEESVSNLGATVNEKYSEIGKIIEAVLTKADQVTNIKVDNMADLMKNGVKEMSNDTKSAFESIVGSISSSMDSAVSRVASAVASMKAMLASVSGGGASATVDVSAGAKVKANAKGGILTKPTIFGYTPATNTYQLGGEAGAEAIAPISTLQKYVAEAVASQNGNTEGLLQQMIVLLQKLLDKDSNTYLDGEKISQNVNKKLGFAL